MPQILFNKSFEQNLNLAGSESLINYAIENDNPELANLIVPTGKLVNHLQLKAVRKYFERYNKPVTNFNILTLKSFVTSIFWKISNQKDYRLISDSYRFALFEEASEKAKLRFYKQSDKPLSSVILQKLSDLIYGLKEDGISVEQLKNELISPGEYDEDIEPEKLSDIISLYETYQNLLGNKYLDYPELLNLTNNIIETDTNIIIRLFTAQSRILFDGFSEFKQPEICFISFFADIPVPLAIVIDYSTLFGPLGATLENTILSLTNKGFKLISNEVNEEKLEAQEQNRKYFISKWLFTPETKVKGPDFKNIVKIFAADSRLDEVVSISRLVKYLIINNNYTAGEICICTRKPDNYSELFREIFSLYNIPVNISDRYPLDRSPVAISVFSLLDILTRGYRRDDIHRAVLSPYLSYLRNTNGDNKSIDGDNLYSVAINLRITGGARRGGAKFWETRLRSYIDALNIKIDKLKKLSSADHMEIEKDLAELSNIKKAFSDFVTLQKMLPKPSGKYLPSEFEDTIKEKILKNFNVRENILKLYDFIKSSKMLSSIERTILLEEVERDGRAFSTMINLLGEFAFIYEERYPKKKFSLEELVNRFKTMVTSAKYQLREKHNYGVTVTSIEQTRGIPYKVMFLCGALDGEFPLSYQTDIFLGKPLPDSEEKHILSERMQFFQFLANDSESLNSGNKKIFITYPRYNEGEELVKSPFIDSLLKLVGAHKEDYEFNLSEMRKNIHRGTEDDNEFEWLYSISNESEFLEYYTKEGLSKIPDNLITNMQTFTQSLDYIKYFRNYKIAQIEHVSKIESEIIIDDKEAKKQNTFSVSDLETYASCPFKYFVRKHIKPVEEKIEDYALEATEKGSIYHNILYRFYSTLQDEQIKNENSDILITPKAAGIPVLASVRLFPEKKPYYIKLLKEIADDELKKIQYAHPFFELEAEEIIGTDKKYGVLEAWLKAELKRYNEGWQFLPSLFEFGFGLSFYHGKSSTVQPVKINDDFYLRGKIDRIEFLKQDNKIFLLVADYKSKSGSIGTFTQSTKNTSFQMPLYLLAAKNILEQYYDIHPELAGAVYYILNPKDVQEQPGIFYLKNNDFFKLQIKGRKPGSIVTKNEMDFILEETTEICTSIINSINNREFPVEPKPGACLYCDYKSICRIDEKTWVGFNGEDENE
ncbi:MAG: hypothetical protein A2X61_12100 [Ignavibacteria bacterium GWB2_35_12]|nr:MAG: hypothetical protein A2X63_04725 [Ignavibacteria bacterium GWA2_35_8]OGU41999.1 MAG: hypothetical protein A2X61_12100 [Ignavibacteria bacterium GWB2_35_12]OGU87282.1 MAG: hypothetical protein A2220_01260 [Ignavibacteria bacterium RIFOXYA2_FULL_35_10]OGV24407.1 MAG: hypothetical protein A2475_12500 [Ignavibacteria bacterium RIFOXYC2_FULL_35_21]